jgi:acetyl esterase
MANDPMPTPNPYLDSQNTHFLEYAAKLTAKVQGSASSLTLKQGRHQMDLEDRPRHEPPHPDIETSHFEVETEFGKVKTFLYKPKGHRKHHLLPFIMHLHGGGFIQGEARDYNVFVFELVRRTGAAVMIPNYTLAPEKRFPTQQEQCLGVLQWVIEHGEEKLRLNVKKMVLTGDSAGGKSL